MNQRCEELTKFFRTSMTMVRKAFVPLLPSIVSHFDMYNPMPTTENCQDTKLGNDSDFDRGIRIKKGGHPCRRSKKVSHRLEPGLQFADSEVLPFSRVYQWDSNYPRLTAQ